MIYNAGDIVVVPFPFVDSSNIKRRPALVLSNSKFNGIHQHSIMAMVTSAQKTRWESDVQIDNLLLAGLNVSSVVRMKLFTLDNRLILRVAGQLDKETFSRVQESLLSNVLSVTYAPESFHEDSL